MSLIEITTNGPVRTVTLARPDKRNALNAAMMDEVRAAFEAAPPADERVTVIRAQGPAFCAGLELSTDGIDKAETVRIEEMFDTVYRYSLPTVAIVHGAAVAGGCELALHCDFIVAANDAEFVMPLAQIGVSTTWFLTKKIIESAGAHLGREFLLLGEPINGARLHDLGIVCRTSDTASLTETASQIVDRLARNAPLSLRSMKAQLVKMNDIYFNADYAAADQVALSTYESTDAVEGISARLAKRQPDFKGR